MSISSPLCAPEAVVRADMPVGPYFFALGASKKNQIAQMLSSKNGFRPRFWRRGQTDFSEIQKSPPGGLAGKLNNFNRAAELAAYSSNETSIGSMGSDAKRGHWLIGLFSKRI
jgi:hypothetical protein